MLNFLLFLPWYFASILVVLVFIGCALAGLLLVRKFVPSQILKAHHDIAGFTFGIIGVIYAVLLGFIAVNVNDRFHSTDKSLEKETTLLIDLFRDAGVFQEKDRKEIRKSIIAYATYVIDVEWDKIAEGKLSRWAHKNVYNIWRSYYGINPETPREQTWYTESVSKLNRFGNTRLERIFSIHSSIGKMMWTFLIVGGAIIIIFMYFFYAESLPLQSLMIALLAGSVAFMLFLILSLDNIYVGDISIKPTYMAEALRQFKNWE